MIFVQVTLSNLKTSARHFQVLDHLFPTRTQPQQVVNNFRDLYGTFLQGKATTSWFPINTDTFLGFLRSTKFSIMGPRLCRMTSECNRWQNSHNLNICIHQIYHRDAQQNRTLRHYIWVVNMISFSFLVWRQSLISSGLQQCFDMFKKSTRSGVRTHADNTSIGT